ncbi:glycoside hydrolase [Pseudoxanthomonas yeongjuensis]|uniref:glycoside hydrolase family 16 protein n=1 Tax=Pseudoxanthomonas yeongjuensis TaxID=377616 RepID=UPI001391F9C6|nr:glycoside hydrolase family 16 protein [Pseudoxanthomonas yeongjuensis]KAF1714966.1 glycoside hydrolase [Pseudoxanthomonas yeongjuensis]
MKHPRTLLDASILLFALHASTCLAQEAAGTAAITASPSPPHTSWSFETTPAWQDEFDYSGLPDPGKWSFEQGGDGWGNHELQYYTHSLKNARVGEGVLSITARRQKIEGSDYSSARLRSKDKGDFLYGRFEVRAKLPGGRGTWPAIWMLPTDQAYGGWPKSGEIDIMEHVGYDPGRIHVTMHTGAYNHTIGTQKTATHVVADAMTQFHRYRVDWTPASIRGYIDDVQVYEFVNEGTGPAAWPFDQRFHFLLNIAVGGDWGGKEGVDKDIFPATMQVDYVRAYRMVGVP